MALLLSYGGKILPSAGLAREGYAPPTPGCRPGALLLRQRAGAAHGSILIRDYRPPQERRVTASGLSPDRTGLRTQVREMLCICGGTACGKLAEHQRIALWTVLRPQLFSGQFPRLCRTCSKTVTAVRRTNGSQSWTRTNTPCGT